MTRCELDCRRVHPLREKSLKLRIDRAVVRRYLIPARFYLPPGGGGLGGCERAGGPPLNRVESPCLGRFEVACKVLEEGLLAQPKESVGLYLSRACGWRWKFRRKCSPVLTSIRCTSSHIDQSRDNRICARLTNDGSCKTNARQERSANPATRGCDEAQQ